MTQREHPERRFSVLFAASLDASDGLGIEEVLDLESAIVSAGRAVLALGGAVVAAADASVASLLSWLAAEYAAPARTEVLEERRPAWPVELHLTTEPSHGLQELERRGSLSLSWTHRDVDAGAKHGGRPRLWDLLDDRRYAGAIILGPSAEGLESDIDAVLTREIEVAIVVPQRRRALEPPFVRDVVGEILERAPRLEGVGRDEWEQHEERPVPYPYVMQTLVRDWRDRFAG